MHTNKYELICIWIGIPKPGLRLNRLAADIFWKTTHLFFWDDLFSQYLLLVDVLTISENTDQTRNAIPCGTTYKFVLNSHVDPIGYGNDVRGLLLLFSMLGLGLLLNSNMQSTIGNWQLAKWNRQYTIGNRQYTIGNRW